jgi:hypothetical protein
LTGRWHAVLERPGYKVWGVIDINRDPDALPPGAYVRDRRWHGRYELEWWRLWGPKEGPLSSTSTGAGTEDEIRHGILAYLDGETVDMTFSPLTSHGPINLWGVWRGDTIDGEWSQRSGMIPPFGSHDEGPPHGTALLTRPMTSCSGRGAMDLAVAPIRTELTLRRTATLHDDSTAVSRRLSVRPSAYGAAVLRFTIDNPCGVQMRVEARDSPRRTLTLRPIYEWPPQGIVCPGMLSLETYTADISGLRAGEWQVRADALARDPVPSFIMR